MMNLNQSQPVSRFWRMVGWQIVPVGILSLLLALFSTRLPVLVQVLALVALPILWGLYWVGHRRFFRPTPLDIPLLIWLLTLPVGLWAAPLREASVPLVVQSLALVALFYAMVNSLHSEGAFQISGLVVLAGGAVLTFLGLLGTKSSTGSPLLPLAVVDAVPQRFLSFWNPASTGFNPNITAGLLAILLPVTVAYAWHLGGKRPLRAPNLVGAGLLWLLALGQFAVLVLSRSQGAMVGFGVALVAVAVARDRRWIWVAPLVVISILLLVLLGPQSSVDQVVTEAGSSAITTAEGRLELASRGLYMLQDFSFTGIGLGMFPKVLPLLYPLFLVSPDVEVAHVHNVYLQLGIDHGFPGLIAFLAFFFLLAMMAIQNVGWNKSTWREPLAIGLLGGLSAYFVHGLVDVIAYSARANLLIWGLWGLITALWCWGQRPEAVTLE